MSSGALERYSDTISEGAAAELETRIETQRSRQSAERNERARSIARALEESAE